MAEGLGQGLGHRRVLDAAGLVARARRARSREGQAERAYAGDPAADRPVAARAPPICARCPTCSSPSTATCSRPTAARAPRRSAAAGSRCTTRAAACSPRARWHGIRCCSPVAAISVGVIDGTPMLDLEYSEDVRAEVDMNVVMTGDGRFVEVQGTAEGVAFTRAELDALLGLAEERHHRDRRRAAGDGRRGSRRRGRDRPDGQLPLPLVLATRQRRQGARDRRDPGRAHRRADRRVGGRRRRATTIAFLLDAPGRHRRRGRPRSGR